MTWLTPMVGAWAAAVAVPALLILYFLRLKRRDLEVSSTLLWKKAVQDLQANAPFQRLRRNLLLFLQLLALAAALFGLAQPQWKGAGGTAQKSVLLIDRSASMSTMDESLDGKPASRLEKSKAQALKFIDELPAGGLFETSGAAEALVIAFDSAAEVVQTFTSNKALLRTAVEGIQPSDAGTSIDEAVRLASAYVGPKVVEDVGLTAGAPLYVYSDGVIPDLSKIIVHPETRIEYRAVGKPETWNIGITALRAQRPYDSPNQLAVFVGLQSTDPAEHSADVELTVAGTVAAVKAVKIPPAKRGEISTGGVIFRLERPEGAVISARVVAEDSLMVDNAARIVVPPAKRLSVAVVTEGNMFLESALGGLALNKAQIITPAQYAEMVKRGKTDEYDVFIMDKVNPARPTGTGEAGPMPPGHFLTFGIVPPMRGLTLLAAADEDNAQPDVPADWVRDHPALELVSLDSLVVAKPMKVGASDGVKVIARGTAGPMIIEAADGPTRALVVCFDPLNSNWPFDVSYVLFLASAVSYLGEDDATTDQQLDVGELITTAMPEGVPRASMKPPSGASAELVTGQDSRVSYGPTRKVGLYEVSWSGTPGPRDVVEGGRAVRTFAVNLFNSMESSVGTRATLDLPAGTVKAQASSAREGLQNLWPWLLLGAVAMVMLEWLVYNRKTYV
jgi:hypothetical protein